MHEQLPKLESPDQLIGLKEVGDTTVVKYNSKDGRYEIEVRHVAKYKNYGFVAVISSTAEYGSEDYESNQWFWGCEKCRPAILNWDNPILGGSPWESLGDHMKATHPGLYQK